MVDENDSITFTPTHVRDEPKIYIGCTVCGGKDKLIGSPSKYEGEIKGDLPIRDIWMQGTDSIHNMCVLNTDATSYQSQTPEKCLETVEKDKKEKYLDACLRHRWHFIPLFVSVDGLIEVKAETTLKRIAIRLVKRWKEPYSRTCKNVMSRIAITLFRAAHCCIWGAIVLASQISVKRP